MVTEAYADEIKRLRAQLASAEAEIKTLRDKLEAADDAWGDAVAQLASVRKTLQVMLDPPATLDEPDTDAEVIIEMREIALAALKESET